MREMASWMSDMLRPFRKVVKRGGNRAFFGKEAFFNPLGME